MEKRIVRIELDKLFGRFDYSINLAEHTHGISILTAPNGYGKSTILNIISSFVSGDHYYFIREKFGSIRFFLSDNEVVEVIHIDDDHEKNQVTIRSGSNQTKIKDPFGNQDSSERSFVVEQALPFLTRISPKTWRHDRTGEIFDRVDILSRYGDHPIFRRNIKRDEWLEKIRKSIKVFSIPTNRLKFEENFDIRGHAAAKSSLMVGAIAKEIQEQMKSAIRNQFEEGRKKETNFPTRLMGSLKEGIAPTKEAIIESIKSVQAYEERYGRLGLVPHTETTKQLNVHAESTENAGTTKQLNVHAESTENAGMLVLKTYLDDIREKFSLLEDLAQRLDVFCSSINQLISFKAIVTSVDEGMVVRVNDGEKQALSLSALSSGEQHLIILIGKLVFNTDRGSLVLIDEPEISFHPEWQEKFLSILEEIQKLNGFDVLLATHSPILIGERWNSVIELAEQHMATGKQLDVGA